MHRVLAPGGKIIVLTSNKFYPHRYRYMRSIKGNYALGRNWDFGPERKFTPFELARLFRNAGFNIVSLEGLQPSEMKLVSLAQKALRRINWPEATNRLEDGRAQRYRARGPSRYFSQTFVHELTKV